MPKRVTVKPPYGLDAQLVGTAEETEMTMAEPSYPTSYGPAQALDESEARLVETINRLDTLEGYVPGHAQHRIGDRLEAMEANLDNVFRDGERQRARWEMMGTRARLPPPLTQRSVHSRRPSEFQSGEEHVPKRYFGRGHHNASTVAPSPILEADSRPMARVLKGRAPENASTAYCPWAPNVARSWVTQGKNRTSVPALCHPAEPIAAVLSPFHEPDELPDGAGLPLFNDPKPDALPVGDDPNRGARFLGPPRTIATSPYEEVDELEEEEEVRPQQEHAVRWRVRDPMPDPSRPLRENDVIGRGIVGKEDAERWWRKFLDTFATRIPWNETVRMPR